MKRSLPLVLVAILSCGPSAPAEPSWGAELVVKVLNRPSDDKAAGEMIKNATRIIEKRLALDGFPYARVSTLDGDRLKIRIPGADATNIKLVASTLLSGDLFEIREMADAALQDGYHRDTRVPEGYLAAENIAPEKRQDLPEYGPWNRDVVLLKKVRIVEHGMITDAWPERSASGTPDNAWHTAFSLSREGAARLDEAAVRLSQQKPPGLIAIVMNGKLKSVVRVTSPALSGEARITGAAGEFEARELALILLSGSLEAQLGSESKEALVYYGTRESSAPQLKKLR